MKLNRGARVIKKGRKTGRKKRRRKTPKNRKYDFNASREVILYAVFSLLFIS